MRLFVLLLSSFSVLLAVSPADQRVAAARQQVDANPKAFQTYNDLAFASAAKPATLPTFLFTTKRKQLSTVHSICPQATTTP